MQQLHNKKRVWLKRILVTCIVLFAFGGGWYLKAGRPWLHAIQAYLYGFPMIVMDLTRQQMTAVEKPEGMNAPVNQFGVMESFPDVTFRAIPRTGLDSLFATSWADLKQEPLILSVPDTSGRYYVIALFDYWSNVFASIGSRTTGNKAGNYLIAGPGWTGKIPEGVDKVYRSPTRWVWVNGQMRADGPKDAELTTNLQKQYLLTPLSEWGGQYTPPETVAISNRSVSKIAPAKQIEEMTAHQFYGRLAELMVDNPPTPADKQILEKLAGLGIFPGSNLDFDSLKAGQQKALTRAMRAFSILVKGSQKLETNQGWVVMPENLADYGTDYLTRAAIALVGIGAVWPKDIMYPLAFKDSDDKLFDGSKIYILHFENDTIPPTKIVWSVSIYDPDGFYVPNNINRYNLSSWMDPVYNQDGSLDIYIQADSPGAEKEANWLPSPPAGTFNLVTRIFWPEKSALDGTWSMPGVKELK